jgi:hypothetical protein
MSHERSARESPELRPFRTVDCAKMNIEEATRSGHPIGLCRAFTNSMRLYFLVDDLEQVERSLAKLEHTAERHSLAPARAVALGARCRYLVRIGRMADGIQHLQESLEKLVRTDFVDPGVLWLCLYRW